MTLELPLLTLGLAGFTGEQQQTVEAMLARGVGEATQWKMSEIDAADAWWLHGARTQALGGDRIRIASGVKGGRSIQLHLPDVDRPLGFARPLPPGFVAQSSFDLADAASMRAVLHQFEAWLAPLTAQFCLAEYIVEHQSALA